eukprot:gene14120-20074_t
MRTQVAARRRLASVPSMLTQAARLATSAQAARTFEVSTLPLKSSPGDFYAVSGCNRGIGLEFTRQLLHRTEGSVIGLSRTIDTLALRELQSKFPSRLHLLQVDFARQETIDKAGEDAAKLTGDIRVLLNVAGVLGDGKTTAGPERSIMNIDRDWLEMSLQTNLIGHVMLTKALVPLLKKKREPSPAITPGFCKIVKPGQLE